MATSLSSCGGGGGGSSGSTTPTPSTGTSSSTTPTPSTGTPNSDSNSQTISSSIDASALNSASSSNSFNNVTLAGTGTINIGTTGHYYVKSLTVQQGGTINVTPVWSTETNSFVKTNALLVQSGTVDLTKLTVTLSPITGGTPGYGYSSDAYRFLFISNAGNYSGSLASTPTLAGYTVTSSFYYGSAYLTITPPVPSQTISSWINASELNFATDSNFGVNVTLSGTGTIKIGTTGTYYAKSLTVQQGGTINVTPVWSTATNSFVKTNYLQVDYGIIDLSKLTVTLSPITGGTPGYGYPSTYKIPYLYNSNGNYSGSLASTPTLAGYTVTSSSDSHYAYLTITPPDLSQSISSSIDASAINFATNINSRNNVTLSGTGTINIGTTGRYYVKSLTVEQGGTINVTPVWSTAGNSFMWGNYLHVAGGTIDLSKLTVTLSPITGGTPEYGYSIYRDYRVPYLNTSNGNYSGDLASPPTLAGFTVTSSSDSHYAYISITPLDPSIQTITSLIEASALNNATSSSSSNKVHLTRTGTINIGTTGKYYAKSLTVQQGGTINVTPVWSTVSNSFVQSNYLHVDSGTIDLSKLTVTLSPITGGTPGYGYLSQAYKIRYLYNPHGTFSGSLASNPTLSGYTVTSSRDSYFAYISIVPNGGNNRANGLFTTNANGLSSGLSASEIQVQIQLQQDYSNLTPAAQFMYDRVSSNLTLQQQQVAMKFMAGGSESNTPLNILFAHLQVTYLDKFTNTINQLSGQQNLLATAGLAQMGMGSLAAINARTNALTSHVGMGMMPQVTAPTMNISQGDLNVSKTNNMALTNSSIKNPNPGAWFMVNNNPTNGLNLGGGKSTIANNNFQAGYDMKMDKTAVIGFASSYANNAQNMGGLAFPLNTQYTTTSAAVYGIKEFGALALSGSFGMMVGDGNSQRTITAFDTQTSKSKFNYTGMTGTTQASIELGNPHSIGSIRPFYGINAVSVTSKSYTESVLPNENGAGMDWARLNVPAITARQVQQQIGVNLAREFDFGDDNGGWRVAPNLSLAYARMINNRMGDVTVALAAQPSVAWQVSNQAKPNRDQALFNFSVMAANDNDFSLIANYGGSYGHQSPTHLFMIGLRQGF